MAIRHQPSAMLGLYLHVPFCSAICNYCNFNRGLFDATLKERYVDALIREIGQAGLKACAPTADGAPAVGVAQPFRAAGADTIFFGGGTPSLLEPDEISRIIEACASVFDVAADCEVTLEANPETVSEARLAAFRSAGVNRLSFGVQSFREEELRRLSRLHTADRARAALGEARAAGFDNGRFPIRRGSRFTVFALEPREEAAFTDGFFWRVRDMRVYRCRFCIKSLADSRIFRSRRVRLCMPSRAILSRIGSTCCWINSSDDMLRGVGRGRGFSRAAMPWNQSNHLGVSP